VYKYLEKNKIKFDVKEQNTYSVMYAINDKNKLNLSKKQDTSIRFDEKVKYDIIEESVYVDKVRKGIYYGTLINDKIVSIASWNEYNKSSEIIDGEPKDVDIGIGTHKDYQRMGYAVSNVVALSEYILDIPDFKFITYHTNNDNINSQKTAESAGLIRITNDKYFS